MIRPLREADFERSTCSSASPQPERLARVLGGRRRGIRGTGGPAHRRIHRRASAWRIRPVSLDARGRALQWAREHHVPEIGLLAFPHNERAVALYRGTGFVQREYYPNDVTRQTGEVWGTILMTKRL